jgi:hypothetical protein
MYVLYPYMLYDCMIFVIILMLEPVDRHEGIAVQHVPHSKLGEQVQFRMLGFCEEVGNVM